MADEKDLAVPDKKTKKMRDGDILISSVMIVGSLWTAYESFRMSHEMYTKGLATLYTVPGLFPFIVSIAILGCSVAVLLNAFREGGDLKYLRLSSLKKSFSNFDALIPTIVFLLMGIYVFVMAERIPFEIATFTFVAVTLITFKAAKGVWAITISAIYSLVIVIFFTVIVGTSFPVSFFYY